MSLTTRGTRRWLVSLPLPRRHFLLPPSPPPPLLIRCCLLTLSISSHVFLRRYFHDLYHFRPPVHYSITLSLLSLSPAPPTWEGCCYRYMPSPIPRLVLHALSNEQRSTSIWPPRAAISTYSVTFSLKELRFICVTETAEHPYFWRPMLVSKLTFRY